MKYFLSVLILPLLFACKSEPIEYKYTNRSNEMFYAKKTGKPFTGQIKNVPSKELMSHNFKFVYDFYQKFLADPTAFFDISRFAIYRAYEFTCDVEVKNGLLDGLSTCHYKSSVIKENAVTDITIESHYKDGSLITSDTYRTLNGDPIKVMHADFTNTIQDEPSLQVFDINNPTQVLSDIQNKDGKRIRHVYSHNGHLIIQTEMTDDQSPGTLKQYDPETGQYLGEVSFDPKFIADTAQATGYYFDYDMFPDSPKTRIAAAFYYNNGITAHKQYYREGDPIFNLATFNTELKLQQAKTKAAEEGIGELSTDESYYENNPYESNNDDIDTGEIASSYY